MKTMCELRGSGCGRRVVGGQSTLAGLLTQPSFYQAGAANCGCHDNAANGLVNIQSKPASQTLGRRRR